MSDTSSSDAKKRMEQPNNDLSKAMGQFSVTSKETPTPAKGLSDMPVDVAGLIIERSDYKQQLTLRKTSKSIRALVDKHKTALKSVKVCCKLDFIFCKYNDHYVAYVSPEWNRDSFRHPELLHTIITEPEFEQVAFDDLALNLKNPKLKLQEFLFDSKEKFVAHDDSGSFDSEFHDKFKTMQNILKSINHQLFVKTCEINIPNPSNAMSILPYLKPGILEKITISSDEHGPGWINSIEAMQQIALLDQWKQAKKLELRSGFPEFLIQYVTHFKSFKIYEEILKLGSLVDIRNCILEHENPQYCLIWFRFCDLPMVGSSHYTNPDSEYYLDIKISRGHVKIVKKKKK